MRDAWIISIGAELALGQCLDTNGAWLAAQLAERGVTASRHVTVTDELDAIVGVLREAATSADVVVATGGLGPTADDLTRVALARAAGSPLELDEGSLAAIRTFFTARGIEMPERNRCQAYIPAAGRTLPNSCGTAPGVRVEIDGVPCFALPGVPFEMRAMFIDHVAPELAAAARGQVLRARALHCFGLPEAKLGELLEDLMRPGSEPYVGTTAKEGVISVRINACASDAAQAERVLDDAEATIRTRLGSAIFGRDADTLESVVGRLLAERGKTLCAAESCTGGLLAKLLTDVSGSSGYFPGAIVSYANEVKEGLLGVPRELLIDAGAVSEPVAAAMAEGARRVFKTTYSVAITGVAGPTGGTRAKPVGMVCFGIASPDATLTRTVRFGEDAPRETIRLRAARTGLHLVRKCIEGRESC